MTLRRIVTFPLLALCIFAMAALAQTTINTPATSPTASSPADISALLDKDVLVIVGPSFLSGNGTPQVGGTVGALMPFTTRLSGGIFADIAFRKTGNPQTNIRGQVSYQAFSLTIAGHDYPVNLLEDVGTSLAASDPSTALAGAGNIVTAVLQHVGTNVGYIAASGVGTDVPLGKTLHLQPYIRVVKGSLNDTAWVAGVNFGLAVHTKKVAGQ